MNADVAQLAAHMTCNHDVAGSIPAFRKKLGLIMVQKASPI